MHTDIKGLREFVTESKGECEKTGVKTKEHIKTEAKRRYRRPTLTKCAKLVKDTSCADKRRLPDPMHPEMKELRQKMESWQDCLTPKEGEVANYSDLSANQEKVSTDVNNCNQ